MSEEAMKREEERLFKSLHKTNNPGQKLKEEAERKKKQEERKKKEEEERKATEERRKLELQKKEEARVKALEQERAAAASGTPAEANPLVDNSSIVKGIFSPSEEEARLKKEEEKMSKMFGLGGGGGATSSSSSEAHQSGSTTISGWIPDKSAAEREEERIRKQFGIKPKNDLGELPHTNKAVVEGETSVDMAKPPTPPVYISGAPVVPQGPATTGTTFETDVWSELNKVRLDPTRYATVLREQEKNYLPDGTVKTPGTDAVHKTKEGVSGLLDAIKYLEQAKPAPVLELSPILSKSSSDLVDDQGPIGGVDIKLRDGTLQAVRLLRYGTWKKRISELLSLGALSGKDAVQQWIIDDGNSTRSNRLTLMDPAFHFVGVSSGYHYKNQRITVATLAAKFTAEEKHESGEIAANTSTSFSASDKELNIANFALAPHGNAPTIDLDAGEARTFVQVKILPSKFSTEIKVFVKGDNVLEVTGKHIDEKGNHVTAIKTITLQTVINAKTFSVVSQNPDGITIKITKIFTK